MHCHFEEDLDSGVDHQVVDGFRVFETRPHDTLELKSGVDELLRCAREDVGEDRTVVDDVQVYPITLGTDPDFQVFVHRFQLLDPGDDVVFDVGSELTHGNDFESV